MQKQWVRSCTQVQQKFDPGCGLGQSLYYTYAAAAAAVAMYILYNGSTLSGSLVVTGAHDADGVVLMQQQQQQHQKQQQQTQQQELQPVSPVAAGAEAATAVTVAIIPVVVVILAT